MYEDIIHIAGPAIIKASPGVLDYLLNEVEPGNRSVPDPYRMPENDFVKAYNLIDRACDAIVEKYKSQ